MFSKLASEHHDVALFLLSHGAFMYAFMYVWSGTHSSIPFHSFTHSFTQSFIHSFIHSIIHSFNHSFNHSFILSLILIHSIIHSLIHSFPSWQWILNPNTLYYPHLPRCQQSFWHTNNDMKLYSSMQDHNVIVQLRVWHQQVKGGHT